MTTTETGYLTGACNICEEEGRGEGLCYQTFDYPAELNTDTEYGAGKCSVCGEFWPLEG